MSKHRRFRPLSPEERRLWNQVARSVKPLKGKLPPPETEPDERPVPAAVSPVMPVPAMPSMPARPAAEKSASARKAARTRARNDKRT